MQLTESSTNVLNYKYVEDIKKTLNIFKKLKLKQVFRLGTKKKKNYNIWWTYRRF